MSMAIKPRSKRRKGLHKADKEVRERIKALFIYSPHLEKILFENEESDGLKQPADKIVRSIGGMSSGDQTLLRLAIDIWSGEGGVKIKDIMALDGSLIERVYEAIRKDVNVIERTMYEDQLIKLAKNRGGQNE